MMEAMKNVVIAYGAELSVKERNLFSDAFKEAVGVRRASWRNLSDKVKDEWSEEYRDKVETELTDICNDVMALIDDHLIPAASTSESTIFYYKMKEDYHRYLAEFKRGVEKEEAVGNSLKSYQYINCYPTKNETSEDLLFVKTLVKKATSLAEAELGPTDPVRLGLALNFSVFYYQILHSPQRACDIARQAFDSAISELHTLDYESFKGSTSLMRLLNENLSLWSPDLPEDHGRAEKKASLKQKRHKKSSRNRGDRLQRSVGMGFRTPKEAIEGNYIDKKCPFTGTVSIRGRIISGICHSAKMTRTVIVRRNYLHYVSKYRRYEKRHSNIPAHVSPCFHVKEGDRLVIGQCRPLSKTVSFNVLKVIPAGSSWKGKKAFTGI